MASAVPIYEDRNVSIGRVFQRATCTVIHNPAVVLGIAVVLGALPSFVMNYVTRSVIGSNPGSQLDTSRVGGAMLVSWIVAVVVGAIVQGALTRAAVAENEGNRASFSDCISAAARVLLPLIAVGFLFALAISIGFVLLIVPGIILMIMWSVAGPAVVVERDGVGRAFGRSAELTSGARWKIFGLFLVLLVIYVLIFTLLGMIGLSQFSAASPDGLSAGGVVGAVVTGTAFNLIWGTIQPSLYLELRDWKEAGGLENLEAVFA